MPSIFSQQQLHIHKQALHGYICIVCALMLGYDDGNKAENLHTRLILVTKQWNDLKSSE